MQTGAALTVSGGAYALVNGELVTVGPGFSIGTVGTEDLDIVDGYYKMNAAANLTAKLGTGATAKWAGAAEGDCYVDDAGVYYGKVGKVLTLTITTGEFNAPGSLQVKSAGSGILTLKTVNLVSNLGNRPTVAVDTNTITFTNGEAYPAGGIIVATQTVSSTAANNGLALA